MNDYKERLVAGFINGSLSNDEMSELEKLIESGEIERTELTDTEQLYAALKQIHTPEPSAQLRSNFYQMLANEQSRPDHKSFSLIKNWVAKLNTLLTVPNLAYTAVLLIIGLFVGQSVGSNDRQLEQLTEEMTQMREMMMVSMLQGASTTDRLRAVNISAELPNANYSAINALLFTLNNDPSINVRVQSVEALARWGELPEVREGLINAIIQQDSDIVIVALADVMVEIGAKNAAENFERLINEKELAPTTKMKINDTIAVLL